MEINTLSSTRVFHQRQNQPFTILCLCNTSLICVMSLKNHSLTSLLFCIRPKRPSSKLLSKMYCEEGRAKMRAERATCWTHIVHILQDGLLESLPKLPHQTSLNLSALLPASYSHHSGKQLAVLCLMSSIFPWPFLPVLRFRNSC